jgi:hypothetical protein
MTRNHETTRLRRYALGALSEEEHVAIEQQYFADGDALEQLAIVEDELIEDYLEDQLDTETRERFERHYLSTPGHRARVSVMRRVIATARAAEHAAERPAPRESRESHSPIATTARASRWSPFQQAALAASIALVLGAGAVWLFNLRQDDGGRSASTSPTAAPIGSTGPNVPNGPNAPNGQNASTSSQSSSQPSSQSSSQPSSPIASSASSSAPPSPSVPSTVPRSDSARAPVVVSLTLSAIATRGAGADPAVTIPENADALLLRLDTGPDDVPVRRGRAVVRTVEGDELWRGPVDMPRDTNASVRGLVRIPAARLRAGDLIVELHGNDASGRESELARYMIRVTLGGRPRSR